MAEEGRTLCEENLKLLREEMSVPSSRVAGLAGCEAPDPRRSDSELLLKGLGVRVLMVTGDNLAMACAVADRHARRSQFRPSTRAIRKTLKSSSPICEQMRATIGPFADRLWREKQAGVAAPFETNAAAEKVYLDIQRLSPQNDLQCSLQSRAAREVE
jgi:hypothetical protein